MEVYELEIGEEGAWVDLSWEQNDKWDLNLARAMAEGKARVDSRYLESIDVFYKPKKEAERADFADVVGLVVSERVKEFLESQKLKKLYFFPVKINGKPFYHIIVKNIVDCLDRKKSVLEYSDENPDKVLFVDRFALKKNKIGKEKLFTIPEKAQRVFITDDLAKKLKEQKFVGYHLAESVDVV